MRILAELQPRGASFVLDGFGAGLIAFRHLEDALFNCVRIGRMWWRAWTASPTTRRSARP